MKFKYPRVSKSKKVLTSMVIVVAVLLSINFNARTQDLPLVPHLNCYAGGCYTITCVYKGNVTILGETVYIENGISCVPGLYACCSIEASCFNSTACPPLP